MYLELINSFDRNRPCHFCNRRPVKYRVNVFGMFGRIQAVSICNMCALTRHKEILKLPYVHN